MGETAGRRPPPSCGIVKKYSHKQTSNKFYFTYLHIFSNLKLPRQHSPQPATTHSPSTHHPPTLRQNQEPKRISRVTASQIHKSTRTSKSPPQKTTVPRTGPVPERALAARRSRHSRTPAPSSNAVKSRIRMLAKDGM